MPLRALLLLPLLAACDGGTVFPIEAFDSGDSGDVCFADGATLVEGFEDTLVPGSCRYRVVGVSEDDSTRLVLDTAAFGDLANGTPISASYTLPNDQASLTVEDGCNVNAECETDEGAPVAFVYTATEGVVTVEGTPDGSGGGVVNVDLTGIALEDSYGTEVTIATLSWRDVALTAAR